MTAQGISRERDRAAAGLPPAAGIDTGPLTGTWVSFDPEAVGIVRIDIGLDGDRLLVQVVESTGVAEGGGAKGGTRTWDTLPAVPLIGDVGSSEAVGFLTEAELAPTAADPGLGSRTAALCAYLNRGLLTIEANMVDLTGRRPNVMSRTHYYRPEGPPQP